MKKILLLVIVALQAMSWSAGASAAPCVTSTLTAYVGLGSAGCTIDGVLFSNFGLLPRPNFTTPFASISVTPIFEGTTVVGFDFGVDPTTSGAGRRFDDLIRYTVTGINTSLVGASFFLNGPVSEISSRAAAADAASVTGIEDICLGGVFTGVSGVDGCSSGGGNARQLVVVLGAFPFDSTTFPPAGFLTVVTDIGVDSGPNGTNTGALQSASNRFVVGAAPAVVPEPTPVVLLAAGLLALVVARRASTGRPMNRTKDRG